MDWIQLALLYSGGDSTRAGRGGPTASQGGPQNMSGLNIYPTAKSFL